MEVSHAPGRISIPDACISEKIWPMNITEWFNNEDWKL